MLYIIAQRELMIRGNSANRVTITRQREESGAQVPHLVLTLETNKHNKFKPLTWDFGISMNPLFRRPYELS